MKVYEGKRGTKKGIILGREVLREAKIVTVTTYEIEEVDFKTTRAKLIESKELKHYVLHSPDGFEWGYAGSGPSDLAYSILWEYLGCQPNQDAWINFRDCWVRTWMRTGWRITEKQITEWYESGVRLEEFPDQR